MIVDLEILKEELKEKLKDVSDDKLKRKIRAIEKSIREYTNNNFMDTKFRFYGEIKNNVVYANTNGYIKEKDNIELSHCLNNDVYTVKEIDNNEINLDCENLFDCSKVMITKVIYPEDIQEGVINMLKWDLGMRNKVGIKSETLSRHSVTYFDMDTSNSLKGYPVALLGFLEDYVKARF